MLGASVQKRMRLAQLDVLRAIAVCMVLASHVHPVQPDADLDVVTARLSQFFRSYGGLGVDLFFVLSGFLVSGILFREFSERGSMNLGRFLVRRGLKIYPAFYVFLIITVLLRLERGSTFTPSEVICEAAFVQNYGPSVWSHTWSLAVEEHFYLLLAGLFLLLACGASREPFRHLPRVFLAVALVVLVCRAFTWLTQPFAFKTHRCPTHLQIDALLFGVLLSYYFNLKRDVLSVFLKWKATMAVLSLALIVAAFAVPSEFASYVFGHVLVYVGFGGIVLVAVNTPFPDAGLTGRVVALAALVGAHSYSIYLWHTAVFVFGGILANKIFPEPPGYHVASLSYMAGSVLFGIAMAKCVEFPVLRLRDRLFPSRVARHQDLLSTPANRYVPAPVLEPVQQ